MAGLRGISRGETEGPARSSASGQLSGAPCQKDIHPEGGRLQEATQHCGVGCIMHLVQFGFGDGEARWVEFATQSRSVRSAALVSVMAYGNPGFLLCAVTRPRLTQ